MCEVLRAPRTWQRVCCHAHKARTLKSPHSSIFLITRCCTAHTVYTAGYFDGANFRGKALREKNLRILFLWSVPVSSHPYILIVFLGSNFVVVIFAVVGQSAKTAKKLHLIEKFWLYSI